MAPGCPSMLELALHACCFVCGIVTAASTAIFQSDLDWNCALYGTVDYNASTQAISLISSSPLSHCRFVIAISVIVTLLSLVFFSYRECPKVTLGICGVLLFFLLITGCIMKYGTESLCGSLKDKVINLTSCYNAQTRKWTSPFKGDKFYNCLNVAETSIWATLIVWILLGIIAIVKQCGNSESSRPLVNSRHERIVTVKHLFVTHN
ncbi:transmembrane protein 179B-like [Denticeps clupeoides]|uniref:Transmembrane protein 179B n=1 Tax=Denticeps clupeoides TaxID=299321 RepID=A0AAY4BS18_9TELE|nr:transmembrane protein 179B-like [Denticeps clupeoides]